MDSAGAAEPDRPPAPGVYSGSEGRPGPLLSALTVDGELFHVHRAADGGTYYDWVSGPNEGYGFGSSGKSDRSIDAHRKEIRTFLAMIDRATGYIGDE